MNTYTRITWSILLAVSSLYTQAQVVNWSTVPNRNKQLVNANLGAEYAVIYGVGYGYRITDKLFPTLLGAEVSIPSGNKLFDDFKTKVGANVRWLSIREFHLSTDVKGVFRRYQNDNVTLANFGLDLKAIVGYYRPTWFAGIEGGFDKAIVTHFRHSENYRIQYPAVKDGWYEPATGGNYSYGLGGGYSLKNKDFYLKLGKIISQDLKAEPLLNFYAQVGFNYAF